MLRHVLSLTVGHLWGTFSNMYSSCFNLMLEIPHMIKIIVLVMYFNYNTDFKNCNI